MKSLMNKIIALAFIAVPVIAMGAEPDWADWHRQMLDEQIRSEQVNSAPVTKTERQVLSVEPEAQGPFLIAPSQQVRLKDVRNQDLNGVANRVEHARNKDKEALRGRYIKMANDAEIARMLGEVHKAKQAKGSLRDQVYNKAMGIENTSASVVPANNPAANPATVNTPTENQEQSTCLDTTHKCFQNRLKIQEAQSDAGEIAAAKMRRTYERMRTANKPWATDIATTPQQRHDLMIQAHCATDFSNNEPALAGGARPDVAGGTDGGDYAGVVSEAANVVTKAVTPSLLARAIALAKANPVPTAVGGIATVAAAYAAYKYAWPKVKPTVVNITARMKAAAYAAMNKVKGWFGFKPAQAPKKVAVPTKATTQRKTAQRTTVSRTTTRRTAVTRVPARRTARPAPRIARRSSAVIRKKPAARVVQRTQRRVVIARKK